MRVDNRKISIVDYNDGGRDKEGMYTDRNNGSDL